MRELIFLVVLSVSSLSFLAILVIPIRTEIRVETLDLWYTQAPFGEIYADISGSFVWGSGRLSTVPLEAYSVKYWNDKQLYSLVLDASETPIVVDGTFQLIITHYVPKDILGFGAEDSDATTMILHLPSLPQNITVGMLAK